MVKECGFNTTHTGQHCSQIMLGMPVNNDELCLLDFLKRASPL
jgi:hypothetical protein